MTDQADKFPNLLTCDDIADILKVDVSQVWSLIRRGKIKAFKLGREYRVERGEFDNFYSQLTQSKNMKEDEHNE